MANAKTNPLQKPVLRIDLLEKELVSDVVVFRHGNKNGDKLTPLGYAQIAADVTMLVEMGYTPEDIAEILFSGANRTHQCAAVAQAVLGLWDSPLTVEKGLNFVETFKETHNSDVTAFVAEMKKIAEAGGTIAHALEISDYAKKGRPIVTETVKEAAKRCGYKKVSLDFSHGPWANLAAPIEMDYDIPEATMVVYKVSNQRGILQTDYISRAPFTVSAATVTVD